MLNKLILVGRLVENPELKTTNNDKKMSIITIAVPRPFKNTNDEYETDFIDCKLFGGVASNTCEYCKKGDVIGIYGRVQNRIIENEDGKRNILEVIVEKISFLSNKK